MSNKKQSGVWNFFKSGVEKNTAICDMCSLVNALGESTATLRTADITLNFMTTKLRAQQNDIGRTLLDNLAKYINRWLDPSLVDLQKALYQPEYSLSKKALEFGVNLLKRLFSHIDISSEQETVMKTQDEPDLTLEEELRQLLEADKTLEKQGPENFSKLKQEFSLFKSTGNRTQNLDSLLNAINTIKPTSIEAERTFSVSNNFCTRIRSSLSDKSISYLVFLKFYFARENSK